MPLSKINSGAIQDNLKLQGDAVELAGGTEDERINSPIEGMLRYNETLQQMAITSMQKQHRGEHEGRTATYFVLLLEPGRNRILR